MPTEDEFMVLRAYQKARGDAMDKLRETYAEYKRAIRENLFMKKEMELLRELEEIASNNDCNCAWIFMEVLDKLKSLRNGK